MEQYFLACGEERSQRKVAIAGSLLRGNAAIWWQRVVSEAADIGVAENQCTWEVFMELIRQAFRPVNFKARARDKLAKLRQRTSVADYVAQFSALAFEIPDLGEAEKNDRFFRGLKPQIATEIAIKGDPETFEELVRMAERIDALRYRSFQLDKPKFFQNRSIIANTAFQPPANGGPTPVELGSVMRATDSSHKRRYNPLTPELRQQLIKEGKCFYCRQPGHTALACSTKKQRPNGQRQ